MKPLLALSLLPHLTLAGIPPDPATTYDPAGNITQIVDDIESNVAKNFVYEYDPLHRLVKDVANAVDGTLKGAKNPVVRDAIKYGQEQHKLYNPGEEYVLNKQIPGTNLRPDALNPQGKTIRELKPDNLRAIQRGQTQLGKYIDAANKAYGEGFRGIIDTYKKLID